MKITSQKRPTQNQFRTRQNDKEKVESRIPGRTRVSENRGIRRFSIAFTANGRNDHVTMFIPHLWLAVFIFKAKLSSFALAPKARIVLHYFLSMYA